MVERWLTHLSCRSLASAAESIFRCGLRCGEESFFWSSRWEKGPQPWAPRDKCVASAEVRRTYGGAEGRGIAHVPFDVLRKRLAVFRLDGPLPSDRRTPVGLQRESGAAFDLPRPLSIATVWWKRDRNEVQRRPIVYIQQQDLET